MKKVLVVTLFSLLATACNRQSSSQVKEVTAPDHQDSNATISIAGTDSYYTSTRDGKRKLEYLAILWVRNGDIEIVDALNDERSVSAMAGVKAETGIFNEKFTTKMLGTKLFSPTDVPGLLQDYSENEWGVYFLLRTDKAKDLSFDTKKLDVILYRKKGSNDEPTRFKLSQSFAYKSESDVAADSNHDQPQAN